MLSQIAGDHTFRTAARVKPGQTVLAIWTTEANVAHAREALRRSGSKLPTTWHLVMETAG